MKIIPKLSTILLMITVLGFTFQVAASPASFTYDANTDFDASLSPLGPGGTNPNGVWIYGETAGLQGLFIPFPDLAEPADVNCQVENMWLDLSDHSGFTPSVAKTIGECIDGNITFEPGMLILHGGPPDRYAHVVFNAPADLVCSVDTTFISRQYNLYADVYILLNSEVIFSDLLIGDPGISTEYEGELDLLTGDWISFVVGLGEPPQYLHPGNIELHAILECVSAVIPVGIDIKPGSDPNSINPKSKGKIPVAILTSDEFQANTVDPSTVRFGPSGAKAVNKAGTEDVDKDGDLDLVLHFNSQETGIQCGDPSAVLTGATNSGQAIQGEDAIRTVGCK